VLEKRLARFGPQVNADKTRLLDFRRPRSQGHGGGRSTFDFPGLTWYWRRTRKGWWSVGVEDPACALTEAFNPRPTGGGATDTCR
jgi:hypothetical protein